jgi:hypothetical protein
MQRVRLNVLGVPTVEPSAAPPDEQPARATIVLVLFGLSDQYTRQELVDVLWPGDDVSDTDPVERKRVNDKLDKVLQLARATLGAAGPRLASGGKGSVSLRRGPDEITQTDLSTDADSFYALASSANATDISTAILLNSGPVGKGVVAAGTDLRWLDRERQRQARRLRILLERLAPDADHDVMLADILAGDAHATLQQVAPPVAYEALDDRHASTPHPQDHLASGALVVLPHPISSLLRQTHGGA